MHLEVKINKEIRDYTEKIFFGLSLRQFIFSILACFFSILVYFSFKDKLSTETLSWICIFVALPFALLGFVKYNGMTADRFLIAFIKSEILMPKRLTFKPKNYYEELLKNKKGDNK